MLVSIITPCRGEGRCVQRFVEQVEAQRLPPGVELELLVAEGRSLDDTYARLTALAAERPWLRLLDNPRGSTPAGLNIAIRHARGEYLVRMDVHTDYAPDYVAECLAALELTGADNVGGPWVARGEGRRGRAIAQAFQSKWSTGGGRAHDPDYEGWVDTVYLGCWPRRTFERFGLFDESLIRGQDSEFNYRIWRKGGRVWQTPRIRSWYQPRRSLYALFRQYAQWGYWKVAILKKHRAPASHRQLAPALCLLGLLVALAATLIEPWAAAPLAAAVALYGLANIAVAFAVRRGQPGRHGSIRAAVAETGLLAAVFPVFHFGYGYGYLRGLVDFLLLGRSPRPGFQQLTRPAPASDQARSHAAGR